jgi:hypothetical protein
MAEINHAGERRTPPDRRTPFDRRTFSDRGTSFERRTSSDRRSIDPRAVTRVPPNQHCATCGGALVAQDVFDWRLTQKTPSAYVCIECQRCYYRLP